MSVSSGPSIASPSSLVLDFDAANIKSYSGSGTSWTDLSPTGITGVLTNGPTYSSVDGGVFLFDATDDYVELNTTMASMVGDISYSIVAWVKINSNRPAGGASIGSSCIIGHNDPYGFGLQIDSGNYVNFGLRSTGNYNGVTALALNTWYHVAGVKPAGSNSFIYVNGVQDGTSSSPTTIITPVATLRIGYGPGRNPAPFDGSISTVQVYTKALSAEEIQQNFNAMRSRYSI